MNDWIEWYGEGRPALDDEEIITIEQRNGELITGEMRAFLWTHRHQEVDIVRYKLVEEAVALKKPPIGIKPKKLHEQDRCMEILKAIVRYREEGKGVPAEWFGELFSLKHVLVDE